MPSLLLRFTKIYTGAKRLFLLFLTIVLSIAQETVQNAKPILFGKCIKYVGKWVRDFKSKSGKLKLRKIVKAEKEIINIVR